MALQTVHTSFTFGFDKGKFAAVDAGVKRATGNLRKATSATDDFQKRMGGFYQRAKGVVGAYLGFRAIKSITTDYAKAADATAKFAAGLGISAQQYQRVNHAARLSGITVEEMNMAIPKLAKSAGDAADGSKSMALAFRRAGVDIKEGGKIKDPIRLLTDLADGMKNVKDEGRKTQILMNIFGRAGKKMGVLLDQGSEGIKKAMAEADKLGIVLSGKQLKAAENYNDEMLRVKSIMLGIRNTIAGRVLPVLTRQLRAFQLWWREGKNAERALRALKLIAFFTSLVLARIVTGAIVKQVKLFTQGIWAMVRSLKAANAAAAITAIKVTAIFAAIALVVLIIEDLIYFAKGHDSLIGRILGKSSLATELRDGLRSIGREAVKAWRELKPALLDAWMALKPALIEIGQRLKPLAGPAFKAAVYALIVAIQSMRATIVYASHSIKTFKAILTSVTDSVKSLAKWLGIDLSDAASKVGKAWKIGMAGMLGALSPITYALEKVIALRNSVFGTDIGSLNLGKKTQELNQRILGSVDLSPTGQPVVGGLFQPAPVAAFAGVGGGGQQINSTISEGAVQMTVNASGDPQTVGKAVDERVRRSLSQLITSTARDLKKPPPGQA